MKKDAAEIETAVCLFRLIFQSLCSLNFKGASEVVGCSLVTVAFHGLNTAEKESSLGDEHWRDAGVAELARLESVCTATPYRGFESLSLRMLQRAEAERIVFSH